MCPRPAEIRYCRKALSLVLLCWLYVLLSPIGKTKVAYDTFNFYLVLVHKSYLSNKKLYDWRKGLTIALLTLMHDWTNSPMNSKTMERHTLPFFELISMCTVAKTNEKFWMTHYFYILRQIQFSNFISLSNQFQTAYARNEVTKN